MSKQGHRSRSADYLERRALSGIGRMSDSKLKAKDITSFLRLADDLRRPIDEVHNGLFVNDLFTDSDETGSEGETS